MADKEKVFSALRNCITVPKCKDCPWDECERFDCKRVDVPVNLLLDVINLLKDQEPVNPVLSKKDRCYFCGKCEDVEIRTYDNYCPHCGRRIKW